MKTTFFICLVLLALVFLVRAYQEYKPKLVTIILPYGHKQVLFEYQKTEYMFDKTGKKVWSKRTIRKPLMTL